MLECLSIAQTTRSKPNVSCANDVALGDGGAAVVTGLHLRQPDRSGLVAHEPNFAATPRSLDRIQLQFGPMTVEPQSGEAPMDCRRSTLHQVVHGVRLVARTLERRRQQRPEAWRHLFGRIACRTHRCRSANAGCAKLSFQPRVIPVVDGPCQDHDTRLARSNAPAEAFALLQVAAALGGEQLHQRRPTGPRAAPGARLRTAPGPTPTSS